MFSYIKGPLADFGLSYMVIEAGGVGYYINASESDTRRLPERGTEIKAYVYMNISEKDVSLFGFLEERELDIFKMLISVNSVGAKTALNILSLLSYDDLITAIVSGDSKSISAANGVGKKTAERIILDLKDKIDLAKIYGDDEESIPISVGNETSADSRSDAILALTSLGYTNSEAMKAVKKVKDTDNKTTDQILKEALKYIM